MTPLKLAIVGGGHLGRIHTRLTANLPDVFLAGVVEPDAASAGRIADEFGCPVAADLSDFAPDIDAAIIASPTHTHFDIASCLLQQGCHLLVEKPLTIVTSQADRLIALADRNNLVLQVGHVERFNPAFQRATEIMPTGRYFEATRMSGYTFRSVDVGVVLDLMIHDIDLVCSLVVAPLVDCRAIGVAVFGPHEDIAQARLEFSDGTVANLTASRCSFKPARKISWFSENGFVAADLAAGTVESVGVSSNLDTTCDRDVSRLDSTLATAVRESLFEAVLPRHSETVEPQNAIQLEQLDFVRAIRRNGAAQVSGRDGRRAVSVAQSILDSIARHQWKEGNSLRVGHQAGQVQLLPVSLRRAG